MKPDLAAGSSLWQIVFFSISALIMLLQILRGWRLGLLRQLVRLGALASAYCMALFGGPLLVPALRSLVRLPDIVLSAAGGAILALLVYSAINIIGVLLFKRTAQHSSGAVRLVWGASGATLGMFFGFFFIWLMIAGVRAIGAVAEAQLKASGPEALPAVAVQPGSGRAIAARAITADGPREESLALTLARLKQSLELGPVGAAVRQTDIIPGGVYDTLAKTGAVFSRRDRVERFLSFPGVAELADSPKILALRADPQIQRMIAEGRIWDLIQDDRLIEAVNDPVLAARLKKFELKKALEYAAAEEPGAERRK